MMSFAHTGSTIEKGVFKRNVQNSILYLLPQTAHRYDQQLFIYLHLNNFWRHSAHISGTGSAIKPIRKTIFTIHILYILCKFQLSSPYSRFWKLMWEE